MQSYRTPGVYFEWLDNAPSVSLATARMDVAGFVGIAQRGPIHWPVKVESWSQYRAAFGGFLQEGYLPDAVDGFFANGGRTCWVVRVADPATATPASLTITDRGDGRGLPVLRLTAASRFALDSGPPNPPEFRGDSGDVLPTLPDPGVWAQGLRVRLVPQGNERFLLTLRLNDGTQERWHNLSLNADDARYVVKVINDGNRGSSFVSVLDLRPQCQRTNTTPLPALPTGGASLIGGNDGLPGIEPKHFSGEFASGAGPWGLETLVAIAEVGIVAIPDLMPKAVRTPSYGVLPPSCDRPPSSATPVNPSVLPDLFPPRFTGDVILELQRALIDHCERMANRMALLDAPPLHPEQGPEPPMDPDQAAAWRSNFDTSYAAAYYPWVQILDPLGLAGDLKTVPPSGHIAGIFTRVEQTIGVHKPPANEVLEQVKDLAVALDDETHGALNDRGINVIRTFPARGIRVAGARTLSRDTDWTYVNVRRLVLMVERAIDVGTQWIVFEPNSQPLQIELDRVVRSYLNDLWRRGMLDGAKADDAYYVRCDDTTNPPEEVDAGRLTCEVGLLPPWPAEFVVIRIGKTEGGTQFMESSGVR
jgi:Bacteriophage tail sheath protein